MSKTRKAGDKQVVEAVGQSLGVSPQVAAQAFQEVVASLVDILRRRHAVEVGGLGTFRADNGAIRFTPADALQSDVFPEPKTKKGQRGDTSATS
ncbi:MAG: hypothetical protein V1760_00115 [Candidatus Peregrinibacteria bacterium]